jgi:hypothetical protein
MIRPSCTPIASDFVDQGLEPVVGLCWLLSPDHREPPQLAFHQFHLGNCWGPSAYEGPQKQDLTIFLEYNA